MDARYTKSSLKDFKTRCQNQPVELSSKKPVSTFRNVFNVKKKSTSCIDPRFNPGIGEYKPDMFRKNYSFVNDIRKNELKILIKHRQDSELTTEQRQKIGSAILRLKQQLKSFDEEKKKEDIKKDAQAIVRDDSQKGRKPQFVNKSEMRILELAEKYKELKKCDKVEKYLAKKRKKQLSKDNQKINNQV